jgi:hypothetical protein
MNIYYILKRLFGRVVLGTSNRQEVWELWFRCCLGLIRREGVWDYQQLTTA